MNPVPFVWRIFGGWNRIKASVDNQASGMSLPTYSQSPTLYRFSGWGVTGFPPKLACNVRYCPGSPQEVDLGRHHS